MSVDRNLVERIAAALVVDASLVEKDWYAMRLVAVVAAVTHPKIQLVFAGAKAYGLIERFSEDLDFKVHLLDAIKQKERSSYREQIINAITAHSNVWSIDRDAIQIANNSKHFQLPVAYAPTFTQAKVLRPHIKLEVTFEPPTTPFETRSLQSFVAQANQQEPEVTSIACISPLETAADKLSALTWRVLARDRSQPNDDPTLVRHLHDLVALEETMNEADNFVPLVLQCLSKDVARDKKTGAENLSPVERVQSMVKVLQTDTEYEQEYEQFVLGMSYAADEDRPTFQDALQVVERLRKKIT